MEVSGQNIVTCDEEKALKCLLDAFGSAFSLEEIASAYCKASRNADLAGEILYEMQGSSSSSASHSSNLDVRVEESSESSDGYSIENSCQERKNSRPKARPVSVGTVSGIIGKDYIRSMPSANGSYGGTQPVKLDARGLPMTGIWREKTKPNISNHNQLHQDMQEFLFKMLGYGFRLDRAMIQEVLESCGYDMQKSMDKLLDRSADALDRRTTVIGDSTTEGFTDMKPESELPERKSQNLNYPSGKNLVSKNRVESHKKPKDRYELQKEILSAFYNGNERCEEAKKTVKDVNRSLRNAHVVFEPPEEPMEEYKIDLDFSRRANMKEDAEDEEEYQSVRKAVKEYRATMNEYYRAAVDEFAKGNKIKAEKLLEQGHFFLKKAREADEESNRMILEPKTAEAQEMLLDLHDCDSKEAIRLLKFHISSLAGIPSFEYLKVIIVANDQENNKQSRKRQAVLLKLLEKESIKWVEGETTGTILIHLDSIDRTSLSFLKT